MSNLYDDRPVQESLDGLWSGVIASNASSATDTVEIIIKAFSSEHRFGPCRWIFNGDKLPQRGNECLVIFDEKQRPFITWWMPTSADWEWPPPPELVSVLPSSPVDTEEVFFQNSAMASQGIVWHLRYRLGSAHARKWEFAGGQPLANSVMTEEVHNSSGSYINLATEGPSLTVPLTGSYRWHIEADGLAPGSGAVTLAIMLSVNDGITSQTETYIVIPTANWRTILSNRGDFDLTAGSDVKIKYYTDGNGAYFRYRRIELSPVRV